MVIAPERVEECLALMGRRGPDASGVFRHVADPSRRALLLHSRLAILDLDPSANQPFRHDDFVISFNGELYNYLELKQRLQADGVSIDTASDTEVLLAWVKRGGGDLDRMAEVLDHCEGMWAFALYDAATGTLWLCRDRFGEKPLYVNRCSHGVFFGSEVKFLAALSGERFAVNMRHVARFLVKGYKALYKVDEGFFQGVRQVPAATVVAFRPHRIEESRRYWWPAFQENPALSLPEAVAGARDALFRSMEIRLRADVPLAFCLSGGVDSNALISIAKRVFDYDAHGFTVENTDPRYDESCFINAAVRELGVRHTKIRLEPPGFIESMRTLIRAHDAPVLTISYYAHWLLMRALAQEGYKVSVSGTGADEIFSGYYDHYAWHLQAVQGAPVLFGEALRNWEAYVKRVVRNPVLQDPLVFVKNPDERRHIHLYSDVFAAFLKDGFDEPFSEESYAPTPMRNRMANEMFHEAVPVLVNQDDLNAMYHSIENRSPFLDRSLYEFCAGVPSRFLISGGYNKFLLREAMRGIVPDVVLDNRRKVGFNAPVTDTVDCRDVVVRRWLLEDSPVFDLVRREKMMALLDDGIGGNSQSKFLFSFIGVKLFLEAFA